MTRVHPKIREFQKRDTPISYSTLSVDKVGQLTDRSSLIDQRIIEGYGVIWGSINDYDEKFVKGAFSRSIAENGPDSKSNFKIKFVDRHGKSCSVFSEIKEDDIGLYFRTVALDDVQWANDVLTQVKSGTLNNFSIGFRHIWDSVEWDEECDCLVVLECRLFEISVVDIPADMATFAKRTIQSEETMRTEIENFIDTLPRPNQLEARKIFTRCIKLMEQEPQEQKRNALSQSNKEDHNELDFNYLISKI